MPSNAESDDNSLERSHAGVVALRDHRTILRVGGSRYFEGTYFYDAALLTPLEDCSSA